MPIPARFGLATLAIAASTPLAAQRIQVETGALAVPAWTRLDPVPGGGAESEFRVSQPVVTAEAAAWDRHLRLRATVDLEGWTMKHGVLTPGAWGEGFYDRRHPHTYVHELMLTGSDLLGRLDGQGSLWLGVGKGFAPYGSDDPMSRPAFTYPVNHHLSQILERAVALAGYRLGPVGLEGSLFNGDEPERPGQWPLIHRDGDWRFGDSWSARLTLFPLKGLELSGSRAKVHSPEHRAGAGTDAEKWHVAARLSREFGGDHLYALVEWARTTEADGFFDFRSILAEAEWHRGPTRAWYRFEQTDRPEDIRTANPFRSVRPHLENSIVGTTRFRVHTAGVGYSLRGPQGLTAEPFGEVALGRMRTDNGIFDPDLFYGSTSLTALSAGIRVSWRMAGHRMGRYGDLLAGTDAMEQHPH